VAVETAPASLASTRVLGNLRDRTFEEQVKKYTAIWNSAIA
jgi:hypothetical protein